MNPTVLTILMFSVLVILSSSILTTTTTASRANPEGMDMGIPGFSEGDDIPGFGKGWNGGGYGGGYSSPSGGKNWSGTRRESKVCKNRGHCHKKKLICPAKCYRAWSKSGKNYGGGGGGGGCVLDCKKCAAYC